MSAVEQVRHWLAAQASPATSFIGLDPAPNMRFLARQRTQNFRQVQILDGSFEHIPLAAQSVDYLFCIFAFHWATDWTGLCLKSREC